MQETEKHIAMVRGLLKRIANLLIDRGVEHDFSKLLSPEAEIINKYTSLLKDSTYGGEEYRQFLKDMKPALDYHYASNRHHPEHFENGVDGMNLVDVVEMLCDWKAASLRHEDGDILKSIEINAKRFELSPQLASIMFNTVELLEIKK